jgi:hypothetical protein
MGDQAMVLIGFLIIAISIFLTTWWVTSNHPYKGWSFSMCLLCVFLGLILILYKRVTEVTIPHIGTIKAAAEQATADANAIAELKRRVENQSATVDLVAKTAADAQQDVRRLRDVTDFSLIVLAAQCDDRHAYDQLWAWSEDSSFPLQRFATRAVQTIMDQHNPAMVRTGFSVSWNEGVDPQKLSLPELWQEFKKAPQHIRLGILEFVWEKRTDIPKRERLQFLVDVIRSDESLQVIEYAGRYFAQGTGDKLKPIAIGPHLKWWEENKDSIE